MDRRPNTGEERVAPTERKDINKFLKEHKDWKRYGTWSLLLKE